MLFYTGINSEMRVSDIVKLKYDDVRDNSGNMKSHITILEQKTKKIKKFPICNDLYIELEKYTRKMNKGDYLFKSRASNAPITTTQAYRIIRKTANKIGLTEIGTHTMRKSFRLLALQTIS